ncbi:hypothetical protein NKI55_02100 [Mesorhizobium sp. M0589]|nr:hypothetical protein [Mesorhizobium sp. LNJC405B00]ESY02342.1 hypothetical protein X755_01550 [Mesorhizobium sp. LNJC405B00]
MSMQETELQYTERLLREMIAEASAAEEARANEARAVRAKADLDKAAKAEAILARAARPFLPRVASVVESTVPRLAEPALPSVVKPELPRTPRAGPKEAIETSRDSLLDGLFPVTEWPQPPRPQYPRLDKKSDRRSDIVFAALGITLGLICALFPWYIFFNQDQFGVQAIKFGGSGTNAGRVSGGSQMENSGQPLTANDVPDVDLFATGTLQDPGDKTQPPGVDEQPFPADPKFRMVHVANGRAMIEDDAGLWIVQRGSKLPDSSVVSSIEQRGGKWVMVTSTDQVIELSK